jgi:ABC-2 type transport system ATP-binding protein
MLYILAKLGNARAVGCPPRAMHTSPILKEIQAITPQVAIQANNLSKEFRTGFWLNQRVYSLKDCSLRVEEGQTFGLLGPNGAGKTTLLKILLGIIRPSGGEAYILGKPLSDQTVKQHIGYLPENPYFYDYLTGFEILTLMARIFEVPAEVTRTRIPQLLEIVGLTEEAARKPLRKYSKGMLQRIGLAQALINDPSLVFLDEPMSGLDPTGRYQMRELILSLKAQGKTVFFNSHILSDVELVCDQVGILVKGELVCCGTLEQLLGTSSQYVAQVQSSSPEPLTNWLRDLRGEGEQWTGILQKDPAQFIAYLETQKIRLLSLILERKSLERLFLEKVQPRPEA